MAHDQLEVALNLVDTLANFPAIDLELAFALAAAHADAALLPRQVSPEPRQPRQQMVQLRQLHLQLALARAGALGEDVENQRGAIEDFALENLFKVAALGRAEFLVEHHRVHLGLFALLRELARLAGADERRGVDPVEPLGAASGDLPTRRADQFLQLVERLADAPRILALELHADDEDPLGLAIDDFDQTLHNLSGRQLDHADDVARPEPRAAQLGQLLPANL